MIEVNERDEVLYRLTQSEIWGRFYLGIGLGVYTSMAGVLWGLGHPLAAIPCAIAAFWSLQKMYRLNMRMIHEQIATEEVTD